MQYLFTDNQKLSYYWLLPHRIVTFGSRIFRRRTLRRGTVRRKKFEKKNLTEPNLT